MIYNETSAVKPRTRHITGIGASNDKGRLIDVLNRLGVCPAEKATPAKLAAHHNIDHGIQISVYDLDRALADVECSVAQRLALKASLDKAGMLFVPKV